MLTKNRIYSCLLVVLALLAPLSAMAYNKSWDQGHLTCVVEPGTSNWGKFDKGGVFHGGYTSKECCNKYCKVCPVYANTGQLQESFTDLSLAGVGPSLTIKRTYNSQDWATSFLGKGWTFNFGKRIIVARRSDNEKIIGLVLETGEKNYYLENPDGSLQRLTGYGATFDLIKNTDGSYTIKDLDGSRTELKADGKIDKIIDRNNNQLTFDYNPVGCVSRITNASGNHIDFQLGPNGKIASATDNFGRSVSYDYDANGSLISVTDPLGNAQQYVYNTDNLLTQRIDARGNTVETIGYDAFQPARVASFVEKGETFTVSYLSDRTEKTDSQGNKWTYYYNDVGIIERTIDPLGNETKQGLNKLTATSVDWEEDANGNRTSYTYDALGNVTSKTDALGNTWSYAYVVGSNRVETETAPDGTVTKYEYDAYGNKTKVIYGLGSVLENSTTATYDLRGNKTGFTDQLGFTETYSYDPDNNLISRTVALGNVTSYTYDNRGNSLTETNAKGSTTTFSYDLNDRLMAVTDALNNTITYTYDADGNKVSETDANGNTTTYPNDAYGRQTGMTDALGNTTATNLDWQDNVIKVTDANGNASTFEYDVQNRLTRQVDALSQETKYSYDPAGNLLATTNARGKVTSYLYDALNRKLSETTPTGETTTYGYDPNGNLASITLPNGNKVSNAYDVLGRLVSSSDSHFLLSSFTYDAVGKVLSETDASGNVVSYTYDADGRLLKKTDTLNNTNNFTYDAVGNLISVTDRDGNVKTVSYDALNRRVLETNADGSTKNYTYDGNGILKTFTDENGAQTSYFYDELNRLAREVLPDGTEKAFGYNAVGNKTSLTDQNGKTTNFTYDKTNQLLAKTYSDGSQATIIYDAAGQVVNVTDTDSSITYTYDDNGRVIQVNQNGKIISYSYDTAGNRASMTTPEGEVVTYGYDTANLMTSVQLSNGKGITYEYDSLYRLSRKDYTGNAYSTFAYDAEGRVLDINHFMPDGTSIYSQNNVYSGSGTLLQKSTNIGQTLYTYDQQYRTTNVDHPIQPDEIFTYDSASNRLTSIDYTDWTYNNRNQLTGYDSITYTYDANGNTLTKTDLFGTTSYTHDHENRLVRADLADGSFAEYKYDALGRRIEKNVNGTVTSYLYDGIWLLAEYDDTGQLVRNYFRGAADSNVSFMSDASGTYFYHHDHLGTPVKITAEGGAVVWDARYQVFGNSTIVTGSIQNNIRFPGQYYDAETGLHYNYYRTYDPNTGRYIQEDLIGLLGGTNLYPYAAANPVNGIDYFGLKITGKWIDGAPKISDVNWPSDPSWQLISPYVDDYGFIKFVRVWATLSGSIYGSVECEETEDCVPTKTWQTSNTYDLSYRGSIDVGINAIGAAVGVISGSTGLGLSVTAALLAAKVAEGTYQLHEKYGEVVQEAHSILIRHGPTAVCNVGWPNISVEILWSK